MAETKIEWAMKVWNPVTGCNKVSAGCKFCYAERLATTRLKNLPEYKKGFLSNVIMHTSRAEQPMHWRKPSIIFVNSMSDLFHESVTELFLLSLFSIMSECKQHIFLILTKRILLAYKFLKETRITLPSNVWLGVSVENQEQALRRIPVLTQIPCSGRFLSCEPLLGAINLHPLSCAKAINWIISGGESGPGARPSHPAWHSTIATYCYLKKIPWFFKQWGAWYPSETDPAKRSVLMKEDGSCLTQYNFKDKPRHVTRMCLKGKHSAGHLFGGKVRQNFPEQFNSILQNA